MKKCVVFGLGENIPSEIADFLNVPTDESLEFTFDHGIVSINGIDRKSSGFEESMKFWPILQKYYDLPPLTSLGNVPIVFKMNRYSLATVSYTAFLQKKVR